MTHLNRRAGVADQAVWQVGLGTSTSLPVESQSTGKMKLHPAIPNGFECHGDYSHGCVTLAAYPVQSRATVRQTVQSIFVLGSAGVEVECIGCKIISLKCLNSKISHSTGKYINIPKQFKNISYMFVCNNCLEFYFRQF